MRLILFFSLSLFCFSSVAQAGMFQKKEVRQAIGTPESRARDEQYRKMFVRQNFIDEGNLFKRKLSLSNALQSYGKATAAENLTTEQDKTFALIYIAEANVFLGDYTDALATWSEYIRIKPKNDLAVDQKRKVEALIEWQKTGNKQPIYDWIDMMKKKNAQWLPPMNPKKTVWQTPIIVGFVELYDLLDEYDAALNEIQPVIDFYRRIKSGNVGEFENLAQALNESKQGMPKICIEDGKVCLGRATAYIIKSKSF